MAGAAAELSLRHSDVDTLDVPQVSKSIANYSVKLSSLSFPSVLDYVFAVLMSR